MTTSAGDLDCRAPCMVHDCMFCFTASSSTSLLSSVSVVGTGMSAVTHQIELRSETIGAVIFGFAMAIAAAVFAFLCNHEKRARQFAEATRDAAVVRAAQNELVEERGVQLWKHASRTGSHGGRQPLASYRKARFEDPVKRTVETMKRQSAKLATQWLFLSKIYPFIYAAQLRARYFATWRRMAAQLGKRLAKKRNSTREARTAATAAPFGATPDPRPIPPYSAE